MFTKNISLLLVVIVGCVVAIVTARPQNSEDEDTPQTIYLPFYGGAKGQFLEIKKDVDGNIVSEKIVDNELVRDETVSIDSESLSTIFNVNLVNIKKSVETIMKLQEKAKKQGLTPEDKKMIKEQLEMLGTSASYLSNIEISDLNPIENILVNHDEIHETFEQNVGEESEAIENPVKPEAPTETEQSGNSGDSTIAEAKPMGLAVAGIGGVAASRPVATAVVSAAGIAIARPIATAVAGVDPVSLGLGAQISHT